MVFTLAAGNRCAPGVWSPFGAAADLDNVITVSAVNSDGQLSSFSNWGAEVAAGGGVSVPPMLNRSGATVSGETGVWSTVSDNGYGAKAGTSMAAPLVAGVAALVREQHPDMGAAQVGRCIVVSAGAKTSIARTRGDYPAAGYDPLIAYDEAIPITDAATAIDCGLDPPTDQAGSEYIARDPASHRSVLVASGTVKSIDDGGTFLCLAKTRLVWNIANLKALAEPTTGNAACDNTGRAEWDIRPGTPPDGGNIGLTSSCATPTASRGLSTRPGKPKPWSTCLEA